MDCKRWKITGWDGEGKPLPPRYTYDEDAYTALTRVREKYCSTYTQAQAAPLSAIEPVDFRSLDGCRGATAVPCEWPAGLSEPAKLALDCYDTGIRLFKYRGRYVVTDYLLTKYQHSHPLAVFGSLDELNEILAQLYNDTAGSRWPA